MRVLYLSDNSSDHNQRFLEKLAASRVDVWFLDPTNDSLREGWLPKGAHWICPEQKVPRNSSPSGFASFLPELQRAIESVRPDVIHAGPTHSAGYLMALSGFHPWLLMSWGWDVLYQPDQGMEWKQATELAITKADAFLFDCDAVRARARELAEFSNDRVVQFPWGLRKGTFSPDGERPGDCEFRREPGTCVFLCTRSWEPIYAVDVLLEAFRVAYQSEPTLRLLLLGDGSQATQVREFVRRHHLEGVAQTPGTISGMEIPKWFRIADVYVSCSKTDGTSISLLNAMATGLPVVVTDIASNREWVTEGHNGWLAASGSVPEFADRMLRAAKLNAEQRNLVSKRNQCLVQERADWDRNFPKLLKMYQQVLG